MGQLETCAWTSCFGSGAGGAGVPPPASRVLQGEGVITPLMTDDPVTLPEHLHAAGFAGSGGAGISDVAFRADRGLREAVTVG
jgi:hypothetical protein